jgi:hypothetical protein
MCFNAIFCLLFRHTVKDKPPVGWCTSVQTVFTAKFWQKMQRCYLQPGWKFDLRSGSDGKGRRRPMTNPFGEQLVFGPLGDKIAIQKSKKSH